MNGRGVAAKAGVDAATIIYHFKSKQNLFVAALALEFSPAATVEGLLAGDPETLGERLVRKAISVWEPPTTHGHIRQLLLAAADPNLANGIREYLDVEVFRRIVEYIGGPNASQRAATLGTFVVGMGMARFILAVGPMASISREEYIKVMVPLVQAALAPPPRRRAPVSRV